MTGAFESTILHNPSTSFQPDSSELFPFNLLFRKFVQHYEHQALSNAERHFLSPPE